MGLHQPSYIASPEGVAWYVELLDSDVAFGIAPDFETAKAEASKAIESDDDCPF